VRRVLAPLPTRDLQGPIGNADAARLGLPGQARRPDLGEGIRAGPDMVAAPEEGTRMTWWHRPLLPVVRGLNRILGWLNRRLG
jgi:hypothetical protein